MGIFALGVVLLVVVALSLPVLGVPPQRPRASHEVDGALVRSILVALPVVLLGLAVLRAGLPEVVYSRHWWYLALIGAGLVLVGIGGGAYAFARGVELPPRPAFALAVASLAFAVLVAADVLFVNPWAGGDALGTIGVFALWLAATTVLGYLVLLGEARIVPLPFFRVFRLSRMPIFALVAVWAVLASVLDTGGYHNVRTTHVTPRAKDVVLVARGRKNVIGAWERWLGTQSLLKPGRPPAKPRRAVPLLLVAAEGGGIRAAYWAALVLDCVLDGGSGCVERAGPGAAEEGVPLGGRGAVFAASGISGGSLGLVTYVTHVRQHDVRRGWVDDRLGDDYLAPTWAWTLFAGLPNAFLRLDLGPDRAAILERTWERSWVDRSASPLHFVWNDPERGPLRRSFLTQYRLARRVPLLLLNGTSVRDGCRLNSSPLNGDVQGKPAEDVRERDCLATGPFELGGASAAAASDWVFGATQDLDDLLCEDLDVRLSTAALLSARFPYVSPSGRIHRCGHPSWSVSVVDGGYFDNTGASPLVELWTRLEPVVAELDRTSRSACVVPVFLQVDNFYKGPRAAPRLRGTREALVPPTAVLTARDARENDARQAAAIAFQGRFRLFGATVEIAPGDRRPVSRYAHVYPRAHPGTEAPLGWVLSGASMDDLRTQLLSPANLTEITKVRRWLSPTLRCAR